MKKKINVKTMIRQIVREEVAMAIKEVITELQKPTQLPQETVSQPQHVQKKVIENKKFSNNSILNGVLNETATFSEPLPSDTSVAGGTSQPNNNVNQGISLDNDLLNKDYSSILKKSMEKSNQKHGM